MFIRNLWITLTRFRLASILNIVGLSVAFAAFMVIMIQVRYEYRFGTYDTDYERIYRFENFAKTYGEWSYIFSGKAFENYIAAEPEIESAAIFKYRPDYIRIDLDGESRVMDMGVTQCRTDISAVFDLPMKEGVFASALEPGGVVLSESAARRIFGDSDPMGRTFHLNSSEAGDADLTVRGIARDLPDHALLQNGIFFRDDPWVGFLFVRVRDAAALDRMTDRFWASLPPGLAQEEGIMREMLRWTRIDRTYFGGPFDIGWFPSGNRSTTLLLFAVALLIIVIAAINFVNFATALTPLRIRGFNTRIVFGESRWRLRGVLVFEAVGIALIAYVVALLWVKIAGMTPLADLLRAGRVSLDGNFPVVGGTAVVALIVGILAGLYPAWYSTRFEPALVLKGSFGLSSKGRRLRTVLIGVQYVVSTGLIIASLFIGLQNRYLQDRPLGYDKSDLIKVGPLTRPLMEKWQIIRQEMLRNPDIAEVSGMNGAFGRYDADVSLLVAAENDTVRLCGVLVRPGLFEMLKIPVVSGRVYRDGDPDYYDPKGAIPNIVLNQTALRMLGTSVDSTFRTIEGDRLQVCGIVGDVVNSTLYESIGPVAYLKDAQATYFMLLKVRPGRMAETVAALRALLLRYDPSGYASVVPFEEALAGNYSEEQRFGQMVNVFSLLAIVLSLVGVFGLVVFETQYRRKEIALRKVSGATTGSILVRFNRSFVRLVLICFAIVVPLVAYGVSEWLRSFAFRTDMSWWVFAVALLIVLLVTLLTVTIQSWRAATANPVESLKSE